MNDLSLITPPETELRRPTQPLRVIGIDLGTTNSSIAEVLWQPGGDTVPQVRCLEVEQSTDQGTFTGPLVPSIVAILGGQAHLGQSAKDLRTRLSDYSLELYKNIFWDCKNHMGIRRTYQKAPAGFQSAKAIGGHLLKFLVDAARRDDPTAIVQTVVTVPASFQAAQRQDTVEAAALAGIEIDEGALLDEPVAAFLDFLMTHGRQAFGDLDEAKSLLVFDFGGGTCDVALFELPPPRAGHLLQVAPLTVSRYHRLGGGDIDRSIVVDVLIPQLLEQNGLAPHVLDFDAKDKFIIPALLGVAESLKIGLCREIARLKRFDRYTDDARRTLVKKNPAFHLCKLGDGRELRLQAPTLSAEQFDAVMAAFLDRDFLYARETDYGLTCSIFAPLQDALDRAGLGPEDVDLCLLVGGSTLIPQIPETVSAYLKQARVLRFEDEDATQTAVARGAAWQSLALALYGQGIVQPVASDDILIQTSTGPVTLIESGSSLPYPADGGWAENNRLVVPRTSLAEPVSVRLELRDSQDAVLSSRLWDIAPPVDQGAPLVLRYRMDGNQVLHVRLALPDDPEQECAYKVENPLTNVVNPNAKRDRIAELEERMRTKGIPAAKQRATVEEIALLYADLGQYERALGLLANLLKAGPDLNVLNRMGIICGNLGDYDRQERFYREAAKVSDSGVPLFNLALSKKLQGKVQEAVTIIDAAIARYPDPPYLVLKAMLADGLKQIEQRDGLLSQAFAAFDPLPTLNDWELGWFLSGTRLSGDGQRQQEAEAEQARRRKPGQPPVGTGDLPGTRTEITRR
jgi:molecular chaperone DnaK